MSDISDEILMAYADGELSSADRTKVEAYLAKTPSASLRLEAFAKTGRELSDMFDAPMREPVPDHLLQAVRAAPVGRARERAPLGQSQTGLLAAIAAVRGMVAPWQSASAFAGLLLAGGAIGWALHAAQSIRAPSAPLVELTDIGMNAANGLQHVLDATPSGSVAFAGVGAAKSTLCPTLTFARIDGSYCRQFTVESAAGQTFASVACRMPSGHWRVEVFVPTGKSPCKKDGVSPAGSQTSPVVEGAVDKMIRGDALGSDAEMKLIASQWRAAPN